MAVDGTSALFAAKLGLIFFHFQCLLVSCVVGFFCRGGAAGPGVNNAHQGHTFKVRGSVTLCSVCVGDGWGGERGGGWRSRCLVLMYYWWYLLTCYYFVFIAVVLLLCDSCARCHRCTNSLPGAFNVRTVSPIPTQEQ